MPDGESTPGTDRYRTELLRRTLLRAIAGTGGTLGALGAASGAPDVVPEGDSPGSGSVVPNDAADATMDPHARLVFRAVADAIVPRTPALGERRGSEHVPGALAVGVDELMAWGLNNFLRVNPTPAPATEVEARLPAAIATALDAAAVELLARGENEEQPEPRYAEALAEGDPTADEAVDVAAAGVFARLAPRDRFRALHLVETHQVDSDQLPVEFREFHADPSHLVAGLQAVVMFGHYSEWAGYENGTESPDQWRFTGDVLSWEQTDFPGPSDGYAVHRGYELQRFRENDWRDEVGTDDDGDPDDESPLPFEPPADPFGLASGGDA